MKEQKDRRFVSVAEAPKVIRQHEAEGTCPNCGAEVNSFCSLYLPHVDGVGFGCPHCSEMAAGAIGGARQVREALNRRN